MQFWAADPIPNSSTTTTISPIIDLNYVVKQARHHCHITTTAFLMYFIVFAKLFIA